MANKPEIVDTPEFQAALEAALEKRMAVLEEKLLEAMALPAEAVEATGADRSADLLEKVLSRLSTNLQALANQGEHNKPLSPEQVIEREMALEQMIGLLDQARTLPAEARPAYAVMSKTYLNDRFIEPFRKVGNQAVRNEITWTGVPNMAMNPLNDVATAIYDQWQKSMGGLPPLVPTADNRPLYMTAAGLTVRGDPPKRQGFAAAEMDFPDKMAFRNDDPNAPEVAVLGTQAARAKQNSVQGKI